MTVNCYVYYRVRAERAGEAERIARAIVGRIGAQGRVNARLAKKAGEPLLWMEIYEDLDVDPAAFVAALDALVDETGLAATLAAGERRHVEVFECV